MHNTTIERPKKKKKQKKTKASLISTTTATLKLGGLGTMFPASVQEVMRSNLSWGDISHESGMFLVQSVTV